MSDTIVLRRNYLQIKARYPEHILLFRIGDFYETFDRDAEIAGDVLGIVVTGRDVGRGVRVPVVGIPYQDADRYIARLVSAGHKIAVCEQVEKPAKPAAVKVHRDPVQINMFGGPL